MFSSVIHGLRVHGVDIGFQILRHPHFSSTETESLRHFATEHLAIHPDRISIFPQIPTDHIHLLVCADVYARFSPQARQTCIVFHGPALQRRFFRRFPFRKTLYQFDKAIVSGPYDLHLIDKYRSKHRKGFEAVVGGFPFLDALKTPALSKVEYYQKLGLDLNKPTVLIGPHWHGLRLAQNHGASYLVDLAGALRNTNVNLLAKLHACSYNTFMAGGVEWQEESRLIASHGFMHVDSDLDDRNAMAYSDILITDMSSRSFTFMLLEKPVIQYFPVSRSWDQWDSPRLERIKQGSLVAGTVADIPKLVLQAQQQEYLQRTQPQEIAAECIAHFGHATDVVVDLLLEWTRDTSGSAA